MNDIGIYLTEFIGTFIFISVILSLGEPIAVSLTLLVTFYFAAKFTTLSSFNPAISLSYLLKGDLSVEKFIMYILIELLAGFVAFMYYKSFIIN